MFWTQRDADNPSVAVATAYMDGSGYRVLRKKGTDSPGGIAIDFKTERVFWVDSTRGFIGSMDLNGYSYTQFELKNRDYFPQLISLHSNGLYLTGDRSNGNASVVFFKNHKDRENLVLKLSSTIITSFTVYSSISQSSYGRQKDCKNHSCPGICLLSGFSFRCVCPVGAKSENNGTTCQAGQSMAFQRR